MPVSKDQMPKGVYFDLTLKDPKERVQKYLDEYNLSDVSLPNSTQSRLEEPRLDEITMHKDILRVTDATATPKCTATFELHVKQALCSRTGNMHGGVVAILMDMCTSVAVAPIATEDYWPFSGVSRTLSINYFRPIPFDTLITVECEVIQIGKLVATVMGSFKRKKDGVILCMARHDKVYVDIAARTNTFKSSL